MASETDNRYAERALELVSGELERRERQVVNDVMAKLAQNEELSGGYAIQKWLELNALMRLRKGLETKAKRTP